MVREAAMFAEDGTKLMIEHGWMEKPPSSVDNINMAKRKS
jgi:hypothetical protein